MLEDSLNRMWFATENGVSYFDGYSFTNYSQEDGLPSNSTIKLYKDYKGRIWFLSYQGELSYFENDSIYTHWINSRIQEKGLRTIDHIQVDTNDNIFLCGLYGGWIYGKASDNTTNSFKNSLGRRPFVYNLFYSTDRQKNIIGFFYQIENGRDSLDNSYPGLTSVILKNNRYYTYIQKQKLELTDSTGFISMGPVLLSYTNDSAYRVKAFDRNITQMAMDSEENLWISEEFKGSYMFAGGDLRKEPLTYFTGHTISKMIIDHEGNYWFSFTDNGVKMIPGLQFHTYNKSTLGTIHDRIISLTHDADNLFFSTGNRGVYKSRFDHELLSIDHSFKLEGEQTTNAKDLLISNSGELWITGNKYVCYDPSGNHIPDILKEKSSGFSFSELSNGRILMATKDGYTIFDTRTSLVQNSKANGSFTKHCYVVVQENKSSFLLGTLNGLYRKNEDTILKITSPEALNHRISAISYVGNTFYVGTFDFGLVVVRPDTSFTITRADGLAGNRIKSLYVENENKIWVGTAKGLSLLQWLPNGSKPSYSISNLSVWDGLPSNEINDILEFKGLFWLATGKGLVSFDPQKLIMNEKTPKLVIESLRLNDNEINAQEHSLSFAHDENNFNINYRVQTFKNCSHINYLYRLEGLEDQWIETQNHNVRYSGLKAGDYTFLVRAKLYNGKLTDVAKYSFFIRKFFTNTYLFKGILITLILIISTSLILKYNKVQNSRQKLERQILLAEQNAVRAQMNPHFIFNSLNSIQNFILDNDEKNANLYLVIFSSLIRKILDGSKRNFISLREEIETIKLYLELEKFRFENQFEYIINVKTAVNADQLAIPSMILQPYLENAIWHGLIPKKGMGLLELNVEKTDIGLLRISISDNGIGREKAALINKRRKHHIPTGMKNVEERLKLLNKMNDTNMRVEIIDLYDNKAQPCGTRVEFLIDV